MSLSPKSLLRLLQGAVLLILLTGCVSGQRISYDLADTADARVDGYGEIRNFLDADLTAFARSPDWRPRARKGKLDSLVISGGGAGGAFGVGILSAWTKRGDRPRFDMVSGVSTGALIAPFAFLGPAYDDTLVNLYTSGVASRLIEPNPLPAGLFGASLWKQAPLRRMVELHLTEAVMQAVAAEHRAGRRLIVLTTNLDSQRAVVWNMGAIADSGQPGALKLFRDVMIASASIPGFYPAVLLKVRSGNRTFEEMHSDGGSASQILAFPDGFFTAEGDRQPPGGVDADMYVIVNNAMMPEFANVANGTFSVMARAYAALVKSQTRSALLATYGFAKREGIGFHVAAIDKQLPYSMSDPFNTDYMRAVFDLGRSGMLAGTLWKDKPVFASPTLAPTVASVSARDR